MAVRYTEEQLNTVDKALLIQMFLNQQEQLETLTASEYWPFPVYSDMLFYV